MNTNQKTLLLLLIVALTFVIIFKFANKDKEGFQNTFDFTEVYTKGDDGPMGPKGETGARGDKGPSCQNIISYVEKRGHLTLGDLSENNEDKSFQLELKGKPIDNNNSDFAKLKITDYDESYPIMVGNSSTDSIFHLKHAGSKVNMKLNGDLELKGKLNINEGSTSIDSNKLFYDLAPIGLIAAFGGTSIPYSWTLCDGSTREGFKTPDLRGKFIRGAASLDQNGETNESEFDEEFRFKNGDIKLKPENLPEHRHDVKMYSELNNIVDSLSNTINNTQNAGNHFHELDHSLFGTAPLLSNDTAPEDSGSMNNLRLLVARTSGAGNRTVRTNSRGVHNHGINSSAQVKSLSKESENTGEGKPFNALPPYYSLVYIIKYK